MGVFGVIQHVAEGGGAVVVEEGGELADAAEGGRVPLQLALFVGLADVVRARRGVGGASWQ